MKHVKLKYHSKALRNTLSVVKYAADRDAEAKEWA